MCSVPWDPMFEPSTSLTSACHVWVEFVDLPEWLWDYLNDFAAILGKVLFLPTNPSLGKDLKKVCIAWNTSTQVPKSFDVWITVTGWYLISWPLVLFLEHALNVISKDILLGNVP